MRRRRERESSDDPPAWVKAVFMFLMSLASAIVIALCVAGIILSWG